MGVQIGVRKMKAFAGSVIVQSNRNRLRLRWTYQGERQYFYLRIADTPENWKVAELKAKQIELDLASGNYDETLEKYKNPSQFGVSSQSGRKKVLAVGLFKQFIEYKKRFVVDRTLVKYKSLLLRFREWGSELAVEELTEDKAFEFRDALLENLEVSTAKEWLGLLRSAWDWGIKKELIGSMSNPWSDVCKIKSPPRQKPKPFTSGQIEKILNVFKRDFPAYADFVEFLFGTGVRTGEAIGLQWKHVSDDCSSVWIGESLSRGVRRATKTNRSRSFGLPIRIQKMLLRKKNQLVERRLFDSEQLVFPSPRGSHLDDHNFRNRIWTKALEKAGVEYRKPYSTRSTFESHAIISAGMNPTLVAEMTGHDPKVLFQHYLGNISGGLQIPDILPTKTD